MKLIVSSILYIHNNHTKDMIILCEVRQLIIAAETKYMEQIFYIFYEHINFCIKFCTYLLYTYYYR